MLAHGVMIGAVLLAAVAAVGLGLAARAARSVDQFRAEHHESFRGKDRA